MGHRAGGRHRQAPGGEELGKVELVLAQVDDLGVRKEAARAELVAERGEGEHVAVSGGDHQVDLLVVQEPEEGGFELRRRDRRRQVEAIRAGLLQGEPIVVAPDDVGSRIAGFETPDQVVAGTGAGSHHQHASRRHPVPSWSPAALTPAALRLMPAARDLAANSDQPTNW